MRHDPEKVGQVHPCPEWPSFSHPGCMPEMVRRKPNKVERAMNMNPSLSAHVAAERQRDMLAQASRLRMIREARAATLAARQTERGQRRTGRLFRRARPAISTS
jgi:hypothetical protein